MDPFWSNVFEYFKDRQVAGAFFRTLLLLIVLLIAGVFLYPLWPFIVPVVAGIFLVWLVRAFLQARARWRYRYKSSPLSRDELAKARSKLMKVKQ